MISHVSDQLGPNVPIAAAKMQGNPIAFRHITHHRSSKEMETPNSIFIGLPTIAKAANATIKQDK
jgi:hypothetical protein